VKVPTFLICAALAITVAVPAAGAKTQPTKGKAQHVALHKAKAQKVKPANRAGSPLYIFVPGPLPFMQPAPADDCDNSGNNCTAEQLCELWGENCDQVPPATTAADDSASDAAVPLPDDQG
jgi:hypothetical protein